MAGVTFNRGAAKRIIRGIRAVEGANLRATAPPRNPRHPRSAGGAVRVAKTDASGITARSGTTAGSGNATIQDVSGTTISAGTVTVQVLNWAATAVAASAYIVIARDRGIWWVIGEDC